VDVENYKFKQGEITLTLLHPNVQGIPGHMGECKWLVAGKNKIWLITKEDFLSSQNFMKLAALNVKGWDNTGATLRPIAYANNTTAVLTDIPLYVDKNVLVQSLEQQGFNDIAKKSMAVSNGQVFSYNIEIWGKYDMTKLKVILENTIKDAVLHETEIIEPEIVWKW
jgi:hypothetical protein